MQWGDKDASVGCYRHTWSRSTEMHTVDCWLGSTLIVYVRLLRSGWYRCRADFECWKPYHLICEKWNEEKRLYLGTKTDHRSKIFSSRCRDATGINFENLRILVRGHVALTALTFGYWRQLIELNIRIEFKLFFPSPPILPSSKPIERQYFVV